jgi:hypothetical protein
MKSKCTVCGNQTTLGDISRPHTCVDEGQEFCAAVVGNVTVEALSRIHFFEDGPSRVGSSLGPALDHLDSH